MSGLLDPVEVMRRLQEIDVDLADRQAEWAKAAEDAARAKRAYEYQHARALVSAEGATVEARKAHALLEVVRNGEYDKLILAEAALEGHKAAFNVLDRRASIGQSLLRAMTNEAFRGDRPALAWSSGRAA